MTQAVLTFLQKDWWSLYVLSSVSRPSKDGLMLFTWFSDL